MARKIRFLVVVSKKSESQDRSSDRGQANTRFEGGTHKNHTERNKMSYGMREREREKRRDI